MDVDTNALIDDEAHGRPHDASTLSVVVHDEYDAHAYGETLKLSGRVAAAIGRAEQRLPTASALIEDIFYSVYQPAPALRPASLLPLSATSNRTIIEQLMATSEWTHSGVQARLATSSQVLSPPRPLAQAWWPPLIRQRWTG